MLGSSLDGRHVKRYMGIQFNTAHWTNEGKTR